MVASNEELVRADESGAGGGEGDGDLESTGDIDPVREWDRDLRGDICRFVLLVSRSVLSFLSAVMLEGEVGPLLITKLEGPSALECESDLEDHDLLSVAFHFGNDAERV